MSKILVIGDVHLYEKSIQEIKDIFEEIKKKYIPKVKEVWFLGDLFHKKYASPFEIDYLTELLIDLQKFCKISILTGNHDELSKKLSAVDYTRHFGIQLDRFSTVKSLHGKTVYLGHHFWNESDKHVKDERFKVKEYSKKYDLSFTGHDHKHKIYEKNVINLGSIRRISYGEIDYPEPKIAIIDSKTFKVTLHDLKSYIPMVEVKSVKECKKIEERTKVRLVFKTFEDYVKNINKVPELEKKFYDFAVKLDFTQEKKEIKKAEKKGISFENLFIKYLKTIKNQEVQNFIQKLLNENL